MTVNQLNREDIPTNEYMGYVQQDDELFQSFTVRECLMFAAKLKLPKNIDLEQRVDEIIASLKLERCQYTHIGGTMVKGISGGERKRASIGVEIIANPNLIFMDEPTTGLDSYTAATMMAIMKDLTDSGRTIVTTIHQPNTHAFDMFDQMMLLTQGKVIYMNDACQAVDYFDSIGYTCPPHTNPADHFMEIMSLEGHVLPQDQLDKSRSTQSQIKTDFDLKV